MIGWLIAAFVAAVVGAAAASKSWAFGEGPFDDMPAGTNDDVIDVHETRSTDGRPYKVTAYRRHEQIYYVAVRSDNSKDWISYLFNPQTKVRLMYRANAATVSGIADLKKDFGL